VRRGLFTPQRWVPLLMVGALLAMVAVAASLATPGIKKAIIPTGAGIPPGNAGHPTPSSSDILPSGSGSAVARPASVMPGWLQAVLGVLCVTLVVTFFAAVLYVAIRNALARARLAALQIDESDVDALEERRQAMIDALDSGIAELARDDSDPRSAVIICWVRLEEVADAAGTPRAVTDTPTDLVGRLLAEHQVSTEALTNLADLYRAARYGIGEISTDMRDRARAALVQLRGELMVSRSGPLAPGGAPMPRPAVPGDRPRPSPGGRP